MDYYAIPATSPATAFVQSAPISGPPSKFWTTTLESTGFPSEHRESGQVATGSGVLPDSTSMNNTPVDLGERGGAIAGATEPESEADRIARQRVQIMVRASRSKASADLLARLEILNSRLVEKVPLVTSAQVAALETAVDRIEAVRSRHEERMRRSVGRR